MVNNFDLIKNNLTFENDDEFFHTQIICRSKDNESQSKNHIKIKDYYIDSLKKLNKLKPEIIKICDVLNARAYINLNKRSYKKIALQTLKTISESLVNEQYKSIKSCYSTTCGRYSSTNKEDKRWLVDIDGLYGSKINLFKEWIEELIKDINNSEPIGKKDIFINPTKNGIHLITKPFDLRKFKEKYPFIEIHKNNPTILYIP